MLAMSVDMICDRLSICRVSRALTVKNRSNNGWLGSSLQSAPESPSPDRPPVSKRTPDTQQIRRSILDFVRVTNHCIVL